MNESHLYDIDKQAFQNITESYDEDIPIWRYFTLLDFVSQISKNKLYFTNIKRHEDKKEGTLSKPSIEETYKRLLTEDNTPVFKNEKWKQMKTNQKWETDSSQERKNYNRSLNKLLQESIMYLIYTNSWIQGKHENILMWNTYGNQKQDPYTIAIKTRIPKLENSFTRHKDKIHIGKVRYIDYQEKYIYRYDKFSEINFEDIKDTLETYYSPALHKESKYESENEIRIVVSYPFISKTLLDKIYINNIPFFPEFPNNWGVSFDAFEKTRNTYFDHKMDSSTIQESSTIPPFFKIDIEPSELIQELWLSPYCKDHREESIRTILTNLNINDEIIKTWR